MIAPVPEPRPEFGHCVRRAGATLWLRRGMTGRLGMALQLEVIDGLAIYAPAGGEGLPAVLILHGSEGPAAGWGHRFCAILAAHGVVAAPFAYGSGDLWGAGAIREVDLRAVVAAGRVIAAHPQVRAAALFGWSFGGGMALTVAALQGGDGPFRAVASHAGMNHIAAAWDPARRPVPGVPRPLPGPDAPRAFVWPGEEVTLTPGAPLPLERIAVPVFLSVGDADSILPPDMTLSTAARLHDLGAEVDLLVGPGQDHGYTFDYEPELWSRLLAFLGRSL